MSEDRKVALVTGATRGIGRAIAAELAGAGWFVVGTATSEKGAAAIHGKPAPGSEAPRRSANINAPGHRPYHLFVARERRHEQ